jgi:hypothetical protein
MSSESGRACRVRIDREDGAPAESWVRTREDDDLWCEEITPGRGSMRSDVLVERIRDAIEGCDVTEP